MELMNQFQNKIVTQSSRDSHLTLHFFGHQTIRTSWLRAIWHFDKAWDRSRFRLDSNKPKMAYSRNAFIRDKRERDKTRVRLVQD